MSSAAEIAANLEGDSLDVVRRALGESDSTWIVGGAVRDAARGVEIVDLDLVVADDPEATARAIANQARAPVFELSEEFGAWRVVAGGWQVDVAALRGGDIRDDLAARDFTLNAMAFPLAAIEAADLLDPHGGLGDLDAGILRMVSARSFSDDPLRLLRAARLAASLGLEVDAATTAQARELGSRAGEPAGERQFAELRQLIGGNDPLRGVALLDQLGLTGAVLPELEALRGVAQNPNHHLDVLGHTLEVLARTLELEADLPAYVGDEAGRVEAWLELPLADECTRRTGLRLAALTHDLGKPATRREQAGFVTFIGHDSVGADIIEGLCSRLRTSRRLSRYLAGIARNHLRLGFLVHQRPLPRRLIYDYLQASDPDPVDLTLLTVADRLSARGSGATASEEMVQGHLELAREMVTEGLDWCEHGPPRSPIRGDELAAELGIDEGPELGRLLAEIEAAVFEGEVASAEQAVEHARASLGG